MKKYLFFAASALAVVSCSNDDYLGNNDGNGQGTNSAILFDGGTSKTTRAEVTTGAGNTYNLQSLQTNGFWVYGYKTTGSTNPVVYQNYYLNYITSSENQSQSNTKGWEYVGVKNSAYKDAFEPKPLDGNQTIKYWDYSADSYTFFAATAKPENLTSGKVKITYNVDGEKPGTYTVTLKEGADLSQLYFADKVSITTKNTTVNREAENEIGGLVKFQFRNVLAKVRVAVFETIPGYSVRIDKFYYTDTDNTEKSNENNFAADVTNTKLGLTETGVDYQVTFNTEGQAVIQPNTSGEEGVKKTYITLGSNIQTATELGTSSTAATYDYENKSYTWFIAQPDNDSPLKLKVDYTLTSLDGSNEQIKVTGATAIVPADYLKWKNNYAYTYIFKISENTNGSTGGDVKGLYPITFDAVVIDTEEGLQETITTVSDPSITTYGKGSVDNEYKPNTNIYVSASKYAAGSAIDLNQTNTKLYVVDVATNVDVTEANVAHCLSAIETTEDDTNSDGTNDTWTLQENIGGTAKILKLTTIDAPARTAVTEIPAADVQGGDAITGKFMKFTPTAAGTYVFEYIEGSGDDAKKYYKVIKVVE